MIGERNAFHAELASWVTAGQQLDSEVGYSADLACVTQIELISHGGPLDGKLC